MSDIPRIEQLIPHRDRMRLIDEIIAMDPGKAAAKATVSTSWPGFGDGGVHAVVIVELIAQTAGLIDGAERLHKGGFPEQGLLAAVKSVHWTTGRLAVGERLTIHANQMAKFAGMKQIAGQVIGPNGLVGEAVLQVAKKELAMHQGHTA